MVLHHIACRENEELKSMADQVLNFFTTTLNLNLANKDQNKKINEILSYALQQYECKVDTDEFKQNKRKIFIFEVLKFTVAFLLLIKVVAAVVKRISGVDIIPATNKTFNAIEGLFFIFVGISVIYRFDTTVLTLELMTLKIALLISGIIVILSTIYALFTYDNHIIVILISLIVIFLISYIAYIRRKTLNQSIFDNIQPYFKIKPYSPKIPTFLDTLFAGISGWMMLSDGIREIF